MGLEKSLNDYLTGQHGKVHFKSDLWGYILPTGNTVVQEPKDGNNVYLTIDKKFKRFLRKR